MGNQEDDDFYHKLSRKELQILCKKCGLPANKSNSHLAKLLASYFQKKNVSSAPTEEGSSGPIEFLPCSSSVSDLKSKSQLNPMGRNNNVVDETRVEAANVDSYGPSCFKVVGYDKRHPEIVNHNELRSHLEVQVSHVVSNSPANVVRSDPSNSVTAEGLGCSNYDIQENASRLLFGSQCDYSGLEFKRKEPSKSNEASDSDQNLLGSTRNSGLGNIMQIQSRSINFDAFPAKSSFISSNGTCTEVPPTFQFYVRSEEGINLSIDLSSSSSDWIQSLKNKVCILPEVQNNKSWALHRELKVLGDNDGEREASFFGNTGAGFQTKGDPICIKSSLGSTVRESGHFGVGHPDEIDRLLRSSAIIPVGTPVEKMGHEENTRRVSSLCKPNSDMQNPINFSTASSPRNDETVPLGLEDPNTSQIRSTGDSVLDSKSGGLKCLDSSEHQSKSCTGFLENTETGSVGTSTLSHERALSLSIEVYKELIPPSAGSHENGSGVCPGFSRSGSMEMQLSEVASHCEDTWNFLRLNDPVHNLQSGNGGSANCDIDQNMYKDSLSASPEERGGSNLMNETESSECSQIDNLLERTCKRSRSSETEGLQSKRQHNHSEDHNSQTKPPMRSLRSVKTLESVLPRRSMRLVSK